MKTKNDFIKRNAIKASIKAKKMRSRVDAIDSMCFELNRLVGAILDESEHIVKKDRKKTILKRHVTQAIEKHIGKSDLTWQELLEQLIQETPADLGKLSKAVNDYINNNASL